jgi:hypothetical protein
VSKVEESEPETGMFYSQIKSYAAYLQQCYNSSSPSLLKKLKLKSTHSNAEFEKACQKFCLATVRPFHQVSAHTTM